jgi:hypothetical protein
LQQFNLLTESGMALPDRTQQVIQTYAAFIHGVATACAQPQLTPQLQPMLAQAEQQGWGKLVAALRLVIAGRRDSGIYAELDDDERIIVEAILRGIQDPATLPDPAQTADPNAAAPGLASMIQASANGRRGCAIRVGQHGRADGQGWRRHGEAGRGSAPSGAWRA